MVIKELRIGNFVKLKNMPVPNSYLIESWREFEMNEFEPIPLTEEWLVKFGFERDQINNTWSNSNSFFAIEFDGNGWVNSINGGEYTNGTTFQHVHQLQNLYFALTGEELTLINP